MAMQSRADEPVIPEPHPGPGTEDHALAESLAGVIDRALVGHREGETFLYGIHQHVSPGVLACLRERYRASGWSGVSLRESATGTYLLVLMP